MHYYQFNIGDYAIHTRHLSPLEDIAYRRLLDLAYTTEQPITKDVRHIARVINLREHQQEITDILCEFWEEVDEGWINSRVLKEIEKTGGKSDKAKQSAKMRWDAVREAKAMREGCESNANASNNNANAIKNDATQDPRPKTHNPRPKTHNPRPKTHDTGKSKTSPASLLAALGVDEKIAADWIILRKQKKAAITETALNGIQAEAFKAGYSLETALRVCCERGWAGFKAEWVMNGGQGKSAYERDKALGDEAERIFCGTSNFIEGSFTNV